MTREELKERVIKAIEENKDSIIEVGRKIYHNPEFGYKEFETTKTVREFFKNELGLETEDKIAYTGCRARVNEEKEGPKVAVLGELDGISCKDHCDANSIGASHTCGHNVQIAGMLGAAVGLIKSGVYKELDGKIDFIATPAEEFVELAYRNQLRKDGHIKYFGGKQELIRKGAFDDVDMAMMFHVLDTGDKKVLIAPESNGFIGKEVKFIGKEAHAGSAPYEGINALNAAMLAINNVHAQRETFKEADRVRFHPIITKGGDIVIKGKRDNGAGVDNTKLGGIGEIVAKQLEELTGLEARNTTLGYMQRGGTPTAFDRVLSTKYGAKAMELALEGKFGTLAVIKNGKLDYASLEDVVGRNKKIGAVSGNTEESNIRKVTMDHDLVKTARDIGINLGD